MKININALRQQVTQYVSDYPKKFNEKNPSITNKSIFTNLQNLDSLLAEIFKYNSGERDSRFKDEMAFKKNINLLNEIYFSPHPLQNPLIKHFQKNNIIKVKGKEYTILNLKIDNIEYKGNPTLNAQR